MDEEMNNDYERLPNGIQFARFAVGERPVCVWEWDLRERNLAFLEDLQPDYYSYVASQNGPELDGKQKQLAAMAIRTTYSQALETFVALACAMAQAPRCVVGWMHFYQQGELESVARAIARGEPFLSLLTPRPTSWESIADACTAHIVLEDKVKERTVREGFSRLWAHLGQEFLEEGFQEEYNSLKHGLRVKPGGFHLRIGRQDAQGVPAAPERMVSLGGSEFGSSYFRRVRLGSSKRHYRLRKASRNWQAGALATRLHLVSLSIENLISMIRTLNGIDPSTLKFVWPDPVEAYEAALSTSVGVTSASFDSVVESGHIGELTPEEILAVYEAGRSDPAP
jgi:hypothetical protein